MKFKSRSYKKTMAALAFTDGIVRMVLEQMQERDFYADVKPHAIRASNLTDTCLKTVPKLLGEKEVRRFRRNLNMIADKFFQDKIDAISLLTYASSLLDEPIIRLQDGTWKEMLKQIYDELSEILAIMERIEGIDSFTPMQQGSEIRTFWETLEW